jgi:hypothetical protein
MKTKKLQKKLGLNKETVVHLNNDILKRVRGGVCTCQETGCATALKCQPFTACNNCETLQDTCYTDCGGCITLFTLCC